MKIELTPRQADMLRGACVLKIESIAEQIAVPVEGEGGRTEPLPGWLQKMNAEARREIDILNRVLTKLNERQ